MGLIQSNNLAQRRPSPIEGDGLFALQEIMPGTRIVEYAGERICSEEMLKRSAAGNLFIFCLGDGDYLDGAADTNAARWINHSCEPNCEVVWENDQVWIVARNFIHPDEEITFNYSYDLEDYRQYQCHCGASECVGYIVAEEFFDHVRRQKILI